MNEWPASKTCSIGALRCNPGTGYMQGDAICLLCKQALAIATLSRTWQMDVLSQVKQHGNSRYLNPSIPTEHEACTTYTHLSIHPKTMLQYIRILILAISYIIQHFYRSVSKCVLPPGLPTRQTTSSSPPYQPQSFKR